MATARELLFATADANGHRETSLYRNKIVSRAQRMLNQIDRRSQRAFSFRLVTSFLWFRFALHWPGREYRIMMIIYNGGWVKRAHRDYKFVFRVFQPNDFGIYSIFERDWELRCDSSGLPIGWMSSDICRSKCMLTLIGSMESRFHFCNKNHNNNKKKNSHETPILINK